MSDAGRPPRSKGFARVPSSGAGWSESPLQGHAGERTPPSASSAQLAVGDTERYEEEYTLGQGGMGVVQAVLDHRLGRRLALKRTRQPDALLEARLRREIRILASLQHPGIVPLLEAGVDEQGRPWYTMPKLPGRTLDEELAAYERGDKAQRAKLLRPMLAVCQAVAHAHGQGFVHRDLKPANVIVGGQGQTFVLDWGLARWADEPEDAPVELLEASPSVTESNDLTAYGQVLGTPRYMSPEQGRGELAERPSDVYALGAMLYAVAYGRALPSEDGNLPPDAFEPDAQGPAPAPALVAIVRKCLAYDPRERYPDAGELAKDLGRFLDGRRVEAHVYSGAELFARFVDRHRIALGIAALAFVSIAALGVVSYFQIREESSRARSAESQTREALLRSEASQRETKAALALSDQRLHDALVGQARAARSVGADPEAERFALEALALGDSPEARGVLAAVSGQGVAQRELGPQIPLCDASSLLPGSAHFLCHRKRGFSLHSMAGPGLRAPEAWSVGGVIALDPEHLMVSHDGNFTTVNRVDDLRELHRIEHPSQGLAVAPGHTPGSFNIGLYGVWQWRWSLDEGLSYTRIPDHQRVCGKMGSPQSLTRRADQSRMRWGLCSNGELFSVDTSSEAIELRAHNPLGSTVTRIAIGSGPSANIIFLAAEPGEVLYVDSETLEVGPGLSTQLGRIRDIAVDPSGTRLALRDDFGRVEIRSIEERNRRLRLPGIDAQAIGFDEAGRLVVARRHLERWTLPESLPLRRWQGDAGFSSVTLSDDDAWMASADGSGFVTLWHTNEASPRWRQRWQKGVAKDCAISRGRPRLVCTSMQGGPRLWRLPDPTAAPMPGFDHISHRRVAWLGDEAWVLSYSSAPKRWLGPERIIEAEGGRGDWKDLGLNPDASALVRLNAQDGAIRVDRRGSDGAVTSRERAKRLGAVAVDLGPADELALVGPGPHVELLDAEDAVLFSIDTPLASRLLDVEVSPDGQLVAAGTLRGEVLVWTREGRLVARLEGHEQRVVKLAFSQDGRFLVSASWDESLRRWELGALGQPLGSVPAPQWELSLDEATRVPGI